MRQQLFLLIFGFFSLLDAKVSIYSHYFGQPEFIKYQYLFFKQNLLDEYEFIVFEDSNNPKISEEIRKECEIYGIKYIHIPCSVFEKPKLTITHPSITINAPSFQCSVAIQYIYDTYIMHSENICLILDNDIFLLSPFSIEKSLGDSSFSYLRQQREKGNQSICYMLPNFIFFNPPIMPAKERLNFNMGSILEIFTDAGGYTYFYLQDYGFLGKEMTQYYLFNTSSNLKIRFGDQYPLLFNSKEWLSHYFIEPDTFLHLRMGSNWSHHSKYTQMREELDAFFQELLKEVF